MDSQDDLTDLFDAAIQATQGPYSTLEFDECQTLIRAPGNGLVAKVSYSSEEHDLAKYLQGKADAEYFAKLAPGRVLDLIQELRVLRMFREMVLKVVEETEEGD